MSRLDGQKAMGAWQALQPSRRLSAGPGGSRGMSVGEGRSSVTDPHTRTRCSYRWLEAVGTEEVSFARSLSLNISQQASAGLGVVPGTLLLRGFCCPDNKGRQGAPGLLSCLLPHCPSGLQKRFFQTATCTDTQKCHILRRSVLFSHCLNAFLSASPDWRTARGGSRCSCQQRLASVPQGIPEA